MRGDAGFRDKGVAGSGSRGASLGRFRIVPRIARWRAEQAKVFGDRPIGLIDRVVMLTRVCVRSENECCKSDQSERCKQILAFRSRHGVAPGF
jgi:hypothetical protein